MYEGKSKNEKLLILDVFIRYDKSHRILYICKITSKAVLHINEIRRHIYQYLSLSILLIPHVHSEWHLIKTQQQQQQKKTKYRHIYIIYNYTDKFSSLSWVRRIIILIFIVPKDLTFLERFLWAAI